MNGKFIDPGVCRSLQLTPTIDSAPTAGAKVLTRIFLAISNSNYIKIILNILSQSNMSRLREWILFVISLTGRKSAIVVLQHEPL